LNSEKLQKQNRDLKNKITELKAKNEDLKKKLATAQLWMEREVKSEVSKIAKEKLSKMKDKTKDKYLKENISDVIIKKV
jgi:hypothetical protein